VSNLNNVEQAFGAADTCQILGVKPTKLKSLTTSQNGKAPEVHEPFYRDGRRFWLKSWLTDYLDRLVHGTQDTGQPQDQPKPVADMPPRVTRAPGLANPRRALR
jgi:hypothetical protein